MHGPCEPVEGRSNSANTRNDLNDNLNANLNNAERHRGSDSNLADRSFTRHQYERPPIPLAPATPAPRRAEGPTTQQARRHDLDRAAVSLPDATTGGRSPRSVEHRCGIALRTCGPRVLDAATPLGDLNQTPQRSDTAADDDTRPSTRRANETPYREGDDNGCSDLNAGTNPEPGDRARKAHRRMYRLM